MLNSPTSGIRTISNEDGATAVEYALMVALIALVIVAAVTALGAALPSLFESASAGLA